METFEDIVRTLLLIIWMRMLEQMFMVVIYQAP